ncbi:MAG: OprO/OprP family phosphate-selective porin [Proteobacteria bacterium]|nr:OprO/OprP family phosphate-selective porin [Pseudomonadota bacterium]
MKSMPLIVILAIACLITAMPSFAGVTYKDGDKYLNIGGRIQLQHYTMTPEEGPSEETLLFRRFRPYIEGSVHKNWKGKFEWDMGKNEFAVKDAYMAYSGLEYFDIIIGNHDFPFSRELLTSSKTQQLVERTFVGDHNYGTPDKQTGVHLKGNAMEKKLAWGASLCMGTVDPDNKKLDFDSVVQTEAGDDWSEGLMAGGRIDFFPMGHMKFSQGDFDRAIKSAIGFAAFTWQNDKDNIDPSRTKNDVDTITGFELSAALRGSGFSVDLEYNSFTSKLMDDNITSGLYEDSETTLTNYAVETGYMISPINVEVVAGYENQNADNYDEPWTRISGGANYFIEGHDIKIQTTYRVGKNLDGKKDNDCDEVFVQCQYVF